MNRQVLKKNSQVFVVKLSLEKGEIIPEHHSSAYVTVTTISGKGVFTIGTKEILLEPGFFLEIEPFEKHSITAHENLEIIVHHIAINQTNNNDKNPEHMCGIKN